MYLLISDEIVFRIASSVTFVDSSIVIRTPSSVELDVEGPCLGEPGEHLEVLLGPSVVGDPCLLRPDDVASSNTSMSSEVDMRETDLRDLLKTVIVDIQCA